jgi:hypothetical protein
MSILMPSDREHPRPALNRQPLVLTGGSGLVAGVATEGAGLGCENYGFRRSPGNSRRYTTVGPRSPEAGRLAVSANQPNHESNNARHGRSRAGGRGCVTLLTDAVSALPTLRLEGGDSVPSLLHDAGHESPHGVPLPIHFLHDLGQRGAALALQHRHHLSGLTALARRGGFLRLRRLFGLGRVLGGAGLLGRLGFRGRALGDRCATLGLLIGLRLRGRGLRLGGVPEPPLC